MANKNNFGVRIKSEQQSIVRITNDDLVCRDCVQRFSDGVCFGNTSRCELYPECKPISILNGGECDGYVKE